MKQSAESIFDTLIAVRGAGDLATAVAITLFRSGFRVVCLETAEPTVIRRTVSFAQAVFDGSCCVEGVEARLCKAGEALSVIEEGSVPVVIDPKGDHREAQSGNFA